MTISIPSYLAQQQLTQAGRIEVLPREVAHRIAAGEVIERPGSVVRELIDNALDAGAREISIELRGGGLELIRVADDGHGLAPDQLPLAFERHATSKLRRVEDLTGLVTLGFRGEALPSIAAVAEVTMLSRQADDEVGASLIVRAGEIVRTARAARQSGTTVTVRHLFHNVPARLKFLPAGRSESLLVGQQIRRYALARPDVAFSLTLDGHPSFRSTGSASLETALAEVYGSAVANAMMPLPPREVEGTLIVGFLTGRTVHRPNRHHLTAIVNGRWVHARELLLALEDTYRPLLPRGRHPIGALVLRVPPEEVDPNVHPAKIEVRLMREREIATALADLTRDVFGHAPARPAPDHDFALVPPQYALPTPRRRLMEAPGPGWDDSADPDEPLTDLRIVAQVRETLILAEGRKGLFLVDQHRAHERVIYHRLLARLGDGAPEMQSLLEPVVLALQPDQAALLEERLPYLEGLGFDVDRFGGRDFLVRAVPALPDGENVTLHLQELLEEAAGADEGWRERLLVSLACRAAVRRGRPLEPVAMRRLLDDLAQTPVTASCPHGSPLILHFSSRFLERQFDW